jgi:hypothetical protein
MIRMIGYPQIEEVKEAAYEGALGGNPRLDTRPNSNTDSMDSMTGIGAKKLTSKDFLQMMDIQGE